MSKTVTFDDRRLVLLFMALDELERQAEAALPCIACVSDMPGETQILLEHIEMLEDCKELKAEICHLISQG